MTDIFSALFDLSGSISLSAYIVAWLILIAAASLGLHVLTAGHCWQDDYGSAGPSARNLAIAIAITSVLLAYPTAAVMLKATESNGLAALALIGTLGTMAIQPVTQWLGWNGSLAKPSPFGWGLSIVTWLTILGIGTQL